METINYVKEKLLIAFYDPDYQIRKTVSSAMSSIIEIGGFNMWPNILEFLTENLSHEDQTVVENSIQAISIIVEDSSKLFEDNKYYGLIK